MAKRILLGEIGRRDVLRAGLIGLGGGIAGFGAGPVNEAAASTPTALSKASSTAGSSTSDGVGVSIIVRAIPPDQSAS